MFTPAELASRKVIDIPAAVRISQASAEAKQRQEQAQQVVPSTVESKPIEGFIGVSGSTYKDSTGAVYYRYRSDIAPSGNYAEGSFRMTTKRGVVEYTPEQAYEKAITGTASYLGINRWDIKGQEQFAPPSATSSYDVLAQREAQYQAGLSALQSRREALRQDFGGTFTPSMQALAAAPIDSNVQPIVASRVKEAEQFALKKQMLEGSKQWSSVKDYEQKYAETSMFGAVTPQKEIYTPESYTQQEAQFDNKFIPEPTHDDKVRYDAMRIAQGAGEGIVIPRFGLMVPKKETGVQGSLSETTGGRFAKSAYEWGEGITKRFDIIQDTSRSYSPDVQRNIALTSGIVKGGVGFGVGLGIIGGGVVGAAEKPDVFAKGLPEAAYQSALMLPANVVSPITSPITQRGLVVGGTEAVGGLIGMVVVAKGIGVVGKPIVSGSKAVVRGGIDVAKGARPRIIQTTEPVAVPGLGVAFRPKYSLELKRRSTQPNQILESQTKGEPIVTEQKGASNFYNNGVLKTTAISKDAPVIDLRELRKPIVLTDSEIAYQQKLWSGQIAKSKMEASSKAQKQSVIQSDLLSKKQIAEATAYKKQQQMQAQHIVDWANLEKVGKANRAFAELEDVPVNIEIVKTSTKQTQSIQPTFAEYSAITGAMAAGQRQATRQIAGQRQATRQIAGQQTKQVQSTGQLTGLKSLNITAQTTKQKTNTEQIATPVSVYKTAQVQSPFTIQSPAMDTVTVQTPKTTTVQVPRTTTKTTTTTTPRLRIPEKPKPPNIPLLSDEEEPIGKKKKKGKKGKDILGSKTSPDFWFPASYESVTKEEMGLGGKRATHIGRGEKKKTTALYSRKIVSRGKAIPTKRQFKASDLL